MAKSNRVGRRKVHAMVGYLCFIAGMFVFIFIGEPLDVGTKLSWQNLFFMCSIPWLTGYVGYNIGWLNGYDNGRIKARDDYRPNVTGDLPGR